jgi:ribosome-associated toxin RatA of RatAB toxin-antitoxin module
MRAMAEAATQSTTINASLDRVWAIVVDVEHYPQWAKDVKQAKVLQRDDSGRPLEVEFRASALGRSTHYTLFYDWSAAPHRVVWKLVKGDLMRAIDGSYTFSSSTTPEGATDVVYDLAIELQVPLPGFVKRRAEVRILNTLKELKARAEEQAA